MIIKPKMILRDWIKLEKLYLNMISFNKNGINLIEYMINVLPFYINWKVLSCNKNAIEILRESNPSYLAVILEF